MNNQNNDLNYHNYTTKNPIIIEYIIIFKFII